MDNLPALPEDNINSLIAMAIDKAVPVEALERLMAMRRELKAEYAKEQFHIAMASFQAECPVIKKTKAVPTKTQGIAYRYAPIESIITQVKHLLQKYGFSYSIETETYETKAKATCIARHNLGHSESSSFETDIMEGNALLSLPQRTAWTLSFCKRYAFCNAFGILTGDSDNDARKEEEQKVSEKQLEFIKELLYQHDIHENEVHKKYHVSKIQDLTFTQANQLINFLKQKK